MNSAAKDYLQAVYELEEEHRPIVRARIAERLGVSAPTVTEGVRRLVADGLVAVEGRTISLTRSGRDNRGDLYWDLDNFVSLTVKEYGDTLLIFLFKQLGPRSTGIGITGQSLMAASPPPATHQAPCWDGSRRTPLPPIDGADTHPSRP